MLNEYIGILCQKDARRLARLILFYEIINNLVKVPHKHILIKAYEGTRKKNNHKFRHIGVNTQHLWVTTARVSHCASKTQLD